VSTDTLDTPVPASVLGCTEYETTITFVNAYPSHAVIETDKMFIFLVVITSFAECLNVDFYSIV